MQKSSVIEKTKRMGARYGRSWLLLGVLIATSTRAVPSAEAAALYWDGNGVTPGSGATPNGQWGTSTFWTTDSTGATATTAYTSGSDVFFAAGTDAVNPYAVTINGTQTANSITFNSPGLVSLGGGINTPSLQIAGGGITANGNAAITSPIALTASQSWTVANNEKLTFSSTVSGAFDLTKAGLGTLSMTASNVSANYTSLTVSAGTLSVDGTTANVLSYQVPTSVASGALLTTTSTKDQALTSLTLNGGTLSSTGTGAWAIGSTIKVTGTTTSTISGTAYLRTTGNPTVFNVSPGGSGGIDLDVPAQITNNAAYTNALTKSGTGVMRLSGNNLYQGNTIVSAGTLLLTNTSGSATGTGAVSVSVGATLGGTGAGGTGTAGATTVTGIVSPGNQGAIGMLTLANSVTWNGAATTGGTNTDWVYQLGSGNSADNLNIIAGSGTGAGNGDFTKGTGTVFRFNFGGSTSQGTYDLIDWTGTTNFAASNFSYTNLGGGDTGSFSIVGNELVFTAVPEPSTIVLPTLLLAVLAGTAYRPRNFGVRDGAASILS